MGGRAARRGARTGMTLSTFLVLCLLVMQPVLCKSRHGISSDEVLSMLTQFTVSGANASSSISVASSDLPSGKYRLHECEKFLDVPAVKGPQRPCSGKLYTEWSQASILVYKPKDVRGLVKAAAARKVKEVLAFETMGPKPNDDLISALSGPNHFIVFSSKEVDAAHAFNKLGQMANSDLLVMILGGQESALSAALDGKVLNFFKKDRDLALLTTSASIALGGGDGADFTPPKVKTEVKAALFGPLIARRTAFMDSGMFHAGLSNDCLQLNAVDLSLRLRNLGHSVSAYVTASSVDGGGAGIPDIASLSKLGTQGCFILGTESAYEKSDGRKLCYRAEDFHQNPAPSGSLIVQYFKRSANIKDIVESFKGYKTRAELIINDDSRSEYADWAAALRDWNKGFLIYSPNIHEIRAYNRLTQFADSETVVYLQDDDLGAEKLDWLGKAKKLFANHADLALLGGFRGRMDFGTVMDSKKHLIQGPKFGVPSSNPRCCIKIPWKDPKSGVPFMFVYKVNMGPMMAKRSLFLKLGMYHPGFSCAGDPGIGFDYEFSIRTWKAGYKVGLTVSEFRNRVGESMDSGTHKGPQKKIRDANEIVNNRAVYRMYSGFHHRQGTRKASTANKDLKGPRWRGFFSDSKADEAYKKTTRGYRRQKMREKRYGSGSSRLQRWQQLQERQRKRSGGRSSRRSGGGRGRKSRG